MEYLKTIQILAQNQKTLKEQVGFHKFNSFEYFRPNYHILIFGYSSFNMIVRTKRLECKSRK